MSERFDHTITVKLDPDNHDWGGAVYLDDDLVMAGDYHDFYPGCHGITKYGDFHGPESLVTAIKCKLLEQGKTVQVVRPECHFDDIGNLIDGPRPKVSAPVSPPAQEKHKLSDEDRAALKEFDEALNEVDRIMSRLYDDVIMEGLYGLEEVEETYLDFEESLQWRKYHAFIRAIKKTTDFE